MKVEQRTVYIAHDGKEFDSAGACHDYEDSLALQDYFEESCYHYYGRLQLEDVHALKDFLKQGKEHILPFMGWKEIEADGT
jgi:hypothetical protein